VLWFFKENAMLENDRLISGYPNAAARRNSAG